MTSNSNNAVCCLEIYVKYRNVASTSIIILFEIFNFQKHVSEYRKKGFLSAYHASEISYLRSQNKEFH